MVLLWRRSQKAAQYVCNVLDAGNARIAALTRNHPATPTAKAPRSSAALSTDPANAFWLNGHEVKDLLTVHVAVGTETGALLAARRTAVSAVAAGGIAQKRKPGGPGAAAAKRRRLGDDMMTDISAKQQAYVSELLMHIAVGDDVQANGGDDLLLGGVQELPTAAPAGDISGLPTSTHAHDCHAAQPYFAADQEMPRPDSQAAVSHEAVELEKKASKRLPSRDRWSQASILGVACGTCVSQSRHVCSLARVAPPMVLEGPTCACRLHADWPGECGDLMSQRWLPRWVLTFDQWRGRWQTAA